MRRPLGRTVVGPKRERPGQRQEADDEGAGECVSRTPRTAPPLYPPDIVCSSFSAIANVGHDITTARCRHCDTLRQTLLAMRSAVRSASAAMVSVGFAVAPVGKVPLPTR